MSNQESPQITRRGFLTGSLAALATASVLSNDAVAAPQALPNIVLINCDDLGYGDLSCYGSKVISTPNVDALAREGVRFTDFYAPAPVCTPSRTGLLTGRYPVRVGLVRVLGEQATDGIPDDETTVAQVLKKKGYATACIGKWHLGHLSQFLPTRHGFDYYYGIPYSNNMGDKKDGVPNCPLMRNEEIIERPAVQDTLTQRYTAEAVKFIKEHNKGPFFLYLAHTMPHNPVHASKAFRGTSKRGIYGDAVQEIDWSLGQVMKALKEQGIERNTLVLFTSDNGPNGGSAGPLRGGKTKVFEGGMREPLIAHWPARIRPGMVCHQPASMLDILPTFAALTGGRKPTKPLDGRDISKLLLGKGNLPDYEFYYFRTSALQAVRFGKWKLHIGRDSEALKQPELYNLDMDIAESRDLAKDRPEIVADLKARIDKFYKTLPPMAKLGGSPWVF